MNESDARAALREMGIKPSRQLIENWIRAAEAEEAWSEPVSKPVPISERDSLEALAPIIATESEQPTTVRSSKSSLLPRLQESGELTRPPGPRRAGRPRIIACWFPKVAETMADGTSLKMALAINGIISLSKSEIRACYRNRTLQALYQEARQNFLAANYGRRPTLRAKIGRYI